MSTTVTSWPRSARQAAVVNPTYPAPMTATLLMAAGLSQYGFIRRDGRPRRLLPAELPGTLEAGPLPPLRVSQDLGHRVAQRLGVAVLDHEAGIVHDLGDARVPKRDHRAATGHRLQAGQPEAFVAAREHKTARRRVQVRELLVDDPAELDGARHARRRLASRHAGDQQPEVWVLESGGGPCPQQRVRVLAGVERPDEQQVAARDAPLHLDAGGGSMPRHEDAVGRLADDADRLPGGEAGAKRVGLRRLGDRDHEVGPGKQPPEDSVPHPLAPHAGTSPDPGDQIVERDHQWAGAPAWEMEVDRVVQIWPDPLDIA